MHFYYILQGRADLKGTLKGATKTHTSQWVMLPIRLNIENTFDCDKPKLQTLKTHFQNASLIGP
jgi:hypothetical protein